VKFCGDVATNVDVYKMEVKRICKWCGKSFVAYKKNTECCSHQCSNQSYKQRMRERQESLKTGKELLRPKVALEGQDYFSFSQAAGVMGVSRQYIYKLVKEGKLRASRLSERKSIIRRADIELMLKSKPYERIIPKENFNITEYYTTEQIIENLRSRRSGYGTIRARQRFQSAKFVAIIITASSTLTLRLLNMRLIRT